MKWKQRKNGNKAHTYIQIEEKIILLGIENKTPVDGAYVSEKFSCAVLFYGTTKAFRF